LSGAGSQNQEGFGRNYGRTDYRPCEQPESCQNVQRFAQSQGCSVKVDEKDAVYTLEIQKTQEIEKKSTFAQTVMLITSDKLGVGMRIWESPDFQFYQYPA
jgi:hypothetical protein